MTWGTNLITALITMNVPDKDSAETLKREQGQTKNRRVRKGKPLPRGSDDKSQR